MPAIGTETGKSVNAPRPRRKRPEPTPVPRGVTGAFGGASSQRPFEGQQRQAAARTERAQSRLPAPVIAAPPVIPNPTRRQTQAAKAQIVASIRRAVGPARGAERVARTDELIAQIHSDPRLAPVRASMQHYAAAEALLNTRRGQLQNLRDRVKPGAPPRRLSAAGVSVNLSELGRSLAAATPGLQAGDAPGQLVRNALKDVGSLAKAPFIAGVGLGGVAVDVASGHPGRAASKVGTFARGVAESTVQEVTHPGRAFSEHPLLTLLDLGGLTSIAGRGAGAVARGAGSTVEAAGVRGALARAGSTVRPPLSLTNDVSGGVRERTYSKDLTRKAAQVAADAAREPVRDAAGNVVTVTRGGREVPVLQSHEGSTFRHPVAGEMGHLNQKAADFEASRANMRERLVRDVAGSEGRVRGVRGRAARDVVAMVAEGTITSAAHLATDLRARLAHLQGEVQHPGNYRHAGELAKARAEIHTIEKVLASPRALSQAQRIVDAGVEHGRRQVAADAANVRAGLGVAAQVKRARLMVTAIAHLKARHVSAEEHAALEVQARAAGDHALADRVSGRDPVRLAAHRDAAARVEGARSRAQAAAAQHARAVKTTQRLAGAHAVRRGQEAQGGPVAAYHFGGQRFEKLADAVAYVRKHPGTDRHFGESAEAYRRRKVRTIERVATSAAEAKRVGEMSGARRAAQAAVKARRAAERDLRLAQHDLRHNPLPAAEAGLRHADGSFLSNQHIEDFLKSRGRDPATVAFLPHRADVVGKRAFHSQFRPGTRPTLDKGDRRTGAAYAKGAQGTTAELLREQGIRQRVQLAKAQSIDRSVEAHGMRHPAWAKAAKGEQLTASERRVVDQGGYWTGKEAAEAVTRAADAGQRLVAVRAFAGKLDADTQRIIRDDYQGPAGMESLSQRLFNSRFLSEGELVSGRARNVVLMNQDYVDRLNAHLKPAGSLGRFAQVLNRAFRYAVLPQPRWLTGNFIEPFIVRLTGVGSGLNVFGLAVDMHAASKTLKVMERSGDPAMRAAAQEIRAQQYGGLFVGGRGATNRRGLGDWPVLDATVKRAYGRLVERLPATQQMLQMTGLLLRGGGRALIAPLKTFMSVNRVIEQTAQKAAFGHSARRDMQDFTGSWIETVKLGDAAVQEAAKGLVGTATQQRFMEAQHELLGKYEGFSPTMRGLIQGPAPFLPWALNAARFVFWTMPMHRTVQTALLVKVNDVMRKDWEQLHSDVPPGGLRLAIPNGKGGWVDIARYTPWGLTGPIASGENWRGVTSQFLPQVGGAEAALEGRDPFGRALQMSSGEKPTAGQEAGIAANSLLEAVVPYLATARRLSEHGETAYSDSTLLAPKTKPGTSHGMSGTRRVFDPLRPTYLGAEAVSSPVSSGPAGPVSRREALLARRAALLQARSGPSSRAQELLARRAQLLQRSR